MLRLILLRHGQSIWNLENRFTGWTDIDLTAQGIQEARQAADEMRKEGIGFDIAFTSVLKRAIRSLWIVMDRLDLMWVPVEKDWRLNERHYGALQGFNKTETAHKIGAEKVYLWRRSFTIPPPALEYHSPQHPRFDRRYAHIAPTLLPTGESLADTLNRVLLCWKERIVPCLRAGKQSLVVAHGNSLRALVKYLENISDEEIPDLNIPTGIPMVYDLDEQLQIVEKRYLGDPKIIAAAAQSVKREILVGEE